MVIIFNYILKLIHGPPEILEKSFQKEHSEECHSLAESRGNAGICF